MIVNFHDVYNYVMYIICISTFVGHIFVLQAMKATINLSNLPDIIIKPNIPIIKINCQTFLYQIDVLLIHHQSLLATAKLS